MSRFTGPDAQRRSPRFADLADALRMPYRDGFVRVESSLWSPLMARFFFCFDWPESRKGRQSLVLMESVTIEVVSCLPGKARFGDRDRTIPTFSMLTDMAWAHLPTLTPSCKGSCTSRGPAILAVARPNLSTGLFRQVRFPFFANNIGKTLSQPERRLIRAYVKWVGDVTMFAHHPLKESGLYTDLFVPRVWTLFEAKASTARRSLREAVGHPTSGPTERTSILRRCTIGQYRDELVMMARRWASASEPARRSAG